MSIKSLYQEIKQWNAKLKVKRKEPIAIPAVDHTYHVCQHCEYGFSGRICPQCGMPAEHVRFTFKRLIHNFLDIWGMGNRPMFRTMRDLIWRPGYMINDYLSGHHLSYFPPFKMLAVLTIFIFFVALIFGFKDPLVGKSVADALNKISGLSKNSKIAFDYVGRLLVYLDKNDLYRILLQNLIVVPAAWFVFRKKGFNLVETFFSQIYINCQIHLITLVWMLIVWELPPTVFLPYYMPASLAILILMLDYKQLYELTVWQAIWHTILFVLLIFAFYFFLLFLLLIGVNIFDIIHG